MSSVANNIESTAEATITLHLPSHWKTIISSCETTLSMLRPFESQDYYLVDAVTKPLRQLIGRGRDLAAMKAYIPPEPSATSHYQVSHKARKTISLNFDPREHWTIADTYTVYAHLHNKTQITCKAVTNVIQLDEAVEKLTESKYIAIDCEFRGVKNNLPQLKVLQLAVSSELGFAILVDQIGTQTCYERLAPILESSDRLLIGWAFRADAQAIENAFPEIKLAPVLDLQEKLRAVAVEQLNLGTAMSRYAQDWPGLDEFSRAKQLGDTFQYTGSECVWLKYPLPPEALVYAVFDVVSLVALQERTEQYPTSPEHYWPQTMLSSLGPKALERWYRDRIMGKQFIASNENTVLADSISRKGKKKSSKTLSTSATTATASEYQDDDPRFLADMEEAIRRSKTETHAKPVENNRVVHQFDNATASCSSPSSSAAAASATAVAAKSRINDPFPRRTIVSNETVAYNDLYSAASVDNAHFADNIYNEEFNKPTGAKIPEGTWEESVTGHKEWNTDKKEEDNAITPVPAGTPSDAQHLLPPSPQAPNAHQIRTLAQVMYENAGGEFAYIPEPEVENWNTLAKTSLMQWKKGTDVDVDWKAAKNDKQDAERASPPAPQMEPTKFHTSIHERRLGSWGQSKQGEDSWTKEEARPYAMNMPLKGIPKIKYKARGPKVVNPFDDGLDSDSDVSSSESDSDEDSVSKPYAQKGNSPVEETYKDDMFLDHDVSVHVHLIKDAAQLTTLRMPDPDEQLTAAITFQVHKVYDRKDVPQLTLKVIQIYLSTGDSYTLLTNRVYRRGKNIEDSAIGYILTSPKVRRIMWGYNFVARLVEEQFGFQSGPMVDLCALVNDTSTQEMRFIDAIHQEHKGKADEELYLQLLKEMEFTQSSKFSSSIWDQERTPEMALNFSALQGYILHEIFVSINAKNPSLANDYIWPSPTLEYHVEY